MIKIKQDRQKFVFLMILLTVLAATIVLVYRMNQPPTTAAVQPAEQKTSSNLPSPNDARIRLDLVEKNDSGDDSGKKNLFQYRQPPAPPPPPRPAVASNAPVMNPAPIPRPGPPAPPPPPPINLKYQGYASVTASPSGLTAFLSDDSRHYNVTVGEILMGRYRIVSISDKSVEVEDQEYNRRQVLPLLN